MDITKYNFEEKLESIVTAIEESTYLAIDGEFTGLDAEGCSHAAPFDTPEERYAKIIHSSTDFMLIQFGLCAFKVNTETQEYEAKPYNFYLFPTPMYRSAPDRRFLCQSSSIDFLVSHGFDFNKLFREGIPYLTAEQEHRMKSALEQKHSEGNNRSGLFSPDRQTPQKTSHMKVPEEHKEFVNDVCTKITTFLESEDTEPLDLHPNNAFQRKLVYQTVEEKFPLVHVETKTGEKKERYMVVHKAKDAEELARQELERQALEMMELDVQVGFTKVIQAIAKSGKLVVGHNMFLDVIHTVNQFHGPLPEDLEGFKSVIKSVLPKILDTKLFASTNPLKDYMSFTSLDNVWKTVQTKPFSPVTVKQAPGFDRYDLGDEQLHEAGYDAFVTGCCFANMCQFLGKFQDPPADFLLPTSSVIEPFVNKLFLMRIADVPYLDLDGADIEVNRDHVFHVTFPKEWRSSDLYGLFEPYGTIQISWLTDTTAYVGLHNKKYAKLAFDVLSEQNSQFHVVSYAFHHSNKSRKWSGPGAKRKIHAEAELVPSKMKRLSSANESSSHPSTPFDAAVRGVTTSDKIPPESLPKKREEKQSQDMDKLFDESSAW